MKRIQVVSEFRRAVQAGACQRQRFAGGLGIFLISSAAIILILACTRYGTGIGTDGVIYIGSARNLLKGYGLSWIGGGGDVRPLGIFAPLFPTVLAFLGLTGLDPLEGARWLNAALFGINILLMGVILYWVAREVWLALLGCLLALFSRELLSLHAAALSEPLFLALIQFGILLLVCYLERGDRKFLIASAGTLGLAYLARYAGVFFVWAGVLTLILLGAGGWRRRFTDAAIWMVGAGIPIGLWMFRNQQLIGSSTSRVFSPVPIPAQAFSLLSDLITFWFLPERIPLSVRVTSVVLVSSFLVGAWLRTVWGKQHGVGAEESRWSRHTFFPVVLLVFIVCYLVGMLVVRSLFSPRIDISGRMLAPAHLLTLLLTLILVHGLVQAWPRKALLKRMLPICCFMFTISYLVRGTIGAIELQRDGQGYASQAWHRSPLINALKLLPAETPIFTNEVEALYLFADRHAYRLPYGCLPDDQLISDMAQAGCQSEEYLAWVQQMRQMLEQEQAVIALFKTVYEQPYSPLVPELVGGLLVLSSQGDGAMYVYDLDQWPPNPHW